MLSFRITYVKQGVSIAGLCGLHFAQLLEVIDIDALKDSLLHHSGHDVPMKFSKEFSCCIHILTDNNVRIVVNDHAVDVVIRANGQTVVALCRGAKITNIRR